MMDTRPIEPPIEFDLADNGDTVCLRSVAEVRAWAERELCAWRPLEPYGKSEPDFAVAIDQQLSPAADFAEITALIASRDPFAPGVRLSSHGRDQRSCAPWRRVNSVADPQSVVWLSDGSRWDYDIHGSYQHAHLPKAWLPICWPP